MALRPTCAEPEDSQSATAKPHPETAASGHRSTSANGHPTRPSPKQRPTGSSSKLSQTKARGAPTIPHEINCAQLTLSYIDLLTGYPSHVLLAAAAADENAQEVPGGGGGKFTEALLDVLTKAEDGNELKGMKYKELVKKVNEFKFSAETTTVGVIEL